MKKARVAPMIKYEGEEGRIEIPMKKKTIETISNDNFDEKKDGVRGKWGLLKNCMRFQVNIQKHYEEVNQALLKEKMLVEGSARRFGTNGLLEHNEASEKRKGFKRGSVRNKDKSRGLIKYFATLSNIEDPEKQLLDFGILESLLNTGCDINTVDKHGQSVLHEVARIWHTDVAQFLLEHGKFITFII